MRILRLIRNILIVLAILAFLIWSGLLWAFLTAVPIWAYATVVAITAGLIAFVRWAEKDNDQTF